ncbi:hypothetical protein B0T19DRAFT_433020 [Cercophora scortea]|uniref:Uncharacterized protein n=1 Tax=Cercophora scortea TaxID=314031 RepID=A0AAE0M597_9PEZI|nr:hypothetical protein B0T19DRAFT_433020 [Cercophora scortea]
MASTTHKNNSPPSLYFYLHPQQSPDDFENSSPKSNTSDMDLDTPQMESLEKFCFGWDSNPPNPPFVSLESYMQDWPSSKGLPSPPCGNESQNQNERDLDTISDPGLSDSSTTRPPSPEDEPESPGRCDNPTRSESEVNSALALTRPTIQAPTRSPPKPRGFESRAVQGRRAVKSLAQAGKGEAAAKRLLACPVYKLCPYQYPNCKQFRLRRMKDVKQHIYRRHMKPQLCDPYHHNASPPANPGNIFISETQKKALGLQYSSRNKPIEEQWHTMWNIIFPGKPQPRSIYLDSQVEGTVPIMRSLWEKKRSENIERVLDKVHLDACSLSAESLGQIMDVVFARFTEIEESGVSEEHDASTAVVKEETLEAPEEEDMEPSQSGQMQSGSSDEPTTDEPEPEDMDTPSHDNPLTPESLHADQSLDPDGTPPSTDLMVENNAEKTYLSFDQQTHSPDPSPPPEIPPNTTNHELAQINYSPNFPSVSEQQQQLIPHAQTMPSYPTVPFVEAPLESTCDPAEAPPPCSQSLTTNTQSMSFSHMQSFDPISLSFYLNPCEYPWPYQDTYAADSNFVYLCEPDFDATIGGSTGSPWWGPG